MKTKNLATLYDLSPLEWGGVVESIEAGITQAPGSGGPDRHTCWLATINPDGSPHVTGVGVMWHDDAFWFETGDATRKGRNLARDSRCTLSVAMHDYDLVIDGTATKVTDPATVKTIAELYRADWPVRVDDSGIGLTAEYSAPSAGPPPWFVYRIDRRAATAVQTVEPGGATRWLF